MNSLNVGDAEKTRNIWVQTICSCKLNISDHFLSADVFMLEMLHVFNV